MSTKPNFDTLMNAVCVGHGYCGSLQDGGFLHVTDFIPKRGQVTAEQFVDWLFMAEGSSWVGNTTAMRHRETLRQYFILHMGGGAVDARKLQWSRRDKRCTLGKRDRQRKQFTWNLWD